MRIRNLDQGLSWSRAWLKAAGTIATGVDSQETTPGTMADAAYTIATGVDSQETTSGTMVDRKFSLLDSSGAEWSEKLHSDWGESRQTLLKPAPLQ